MFSIFSSAGIVPLLSKPGGLARNRSMAGVIRLTMGLAWAAILLSARTPPFCMRLSELSSTRCALRSLAYSSATPRQRRRSISASSASRRSGWSA